MDIFMLCINVRSFVALPQAFISLTQIPLYDLTQSLYILILWQALFVLADTCDLTAGHRIFQIWTNLFNLPHILSDYEICWTIKSVLSDLKAYNYNSVLDKFWLNFQMSG